MLKANDACEAPGNVAQVDGTLASAIRFDCCMSVTAGLVLRNAMVYHGESVGPIRSMGRCSMNLMLHRDQDTDAGSEDVVGTQVRVRHLEIVEVPACRARLAVRTKIIEGKAQRGCAVVL